MSWTHYLMSVALGEPGQPTAIAIVGQVIDLNRGLGLETLKLELSHLDQVPGDVSMPDLAERVDGYLRALQAQDGSNRPPALLVDSSMAAKTLLQMQYWGRHGAINVNVTNGAAVHVLETGGLGIPRRELAGALVIALQERQPRAREKPLLEIAGGLALRPRLVQALGSFKSRPPTNADDVLVAMREQADDALVIAAGMCVLRARQATPDERQARPQNWDYDPLGDFGPLSGLDRAWGYDS